MQSSRLEIRDGSPAGQEEMKTSQVLLDSLDEIHLPSWLTSSCFLGRNVVEICRQSLLISRWFAGVCHHCFYFLFSYNILCNRAVTFQTAASQKTMCHVRVYLDPVHLIRQYHAAAPVEIVFRTDCVREVNKIGTQVEEAAPINRGNRATAHSFAPPVSIRPSSTNSI